jgi:hypothetical protein
MRFIALSWGLSITINTSRPPQPSILAIYRLDLSHPLGTEKGLSVPFKNASLSRGTQKIRIENKGGTALISVRSTGEVSALRTADEEYFATSA